MISKTKSYTTSDKRAFLSIAEAKAHELRLKLEPSGGDMAPALESAIQAMVQNPDVFIAILKLREPQKRAPRAKKAAASPKLTKQS